MRSGLKQKLTRYRQRAMTVIGSLRDARTVGQLLFLVVVLLVSWSGIKAINANYTLEKQIAQLQQQNTIQQLENNNLKLQNNYYNSNQYLELSARQNLGLAIPGETEITVPAQVALSYVAPEPSPPTAKPNATVP